MYANIGELGQTEGEQIHNRAVAALAKYDDLFARSQRVASAEERANLAARFGVPKTQDSPAYFADNVRWYIGEAQKYVPTNYDVWTTTTRPVHRVEGLEAAVAPLGTAVSDAERRAGILPPEKGTTTVVTKTQTVTKEVEAQLLGLPTTTWLYILGGTAAVAVVGAIVVAATKKSKKAASVAGWE
jgi:hypothetical protein